MFNPVTIHSEHDKDEKTGHYSLQMIVTFDNFQIYRPQIMKIMEQQNYVSTRSKIKKFYVFLGYDS